MSKLNSENRKTLNRRQALLLPATAGIGAALALPAKASDSTKTAAHQAPGGCSTPRSAVAKTQYGKVRGFVDAGVLTFKGIPYGQNTGGENRWLPAKPPKPWDGEYPALVYGANCPQRLHDFTAIEQSFLYDWDDGYMSEDMLKLNVWTPSLTGKRPVLVYFHGGGFTFGSAYELPSQEGAQLARHHDAVSVTVNHRLNLLGFLDMSEIGGPAYADSVNVGMTDLVASLRWIRENIANFGGDPDAVMIYGQSGGGSKVTCLMGMPSAAGLFHRASAQSGGGGNIPGTEQSRELARQLMKELGLRPNDLAALQKMEWAKLNAAGNAAIAKLSPPAQGATGPGSAAERDAARRVVAHRRWPDRDAAFVLRRRPGNFEECADVDRQRQRRRESHVVPSHRGGVACHPRPDHGRGQGDSAHRGDEEGASGEEHSHAVLRRERPQLAEQRPAHGEAEVRTEGRAGLSVLLHLAIADAGGCGRLAHGRTRLLLR